MARRLALLVFLALGGCSGGEPIEQAQEAPRASSFRSAAIDRVLDEVTRTLRTRGFAARDEDERGFLIEHDTLSREASLAATGCVVAVASSSAALRELDLRVYDSDGSELARDSLEGSTAATQLCPPHAGTFYFVARAASGSGLSAIRIFEGPAGLSVRLDDLVAPPAGGIAPE